MFSIVFDETRKTYRIVLSKIVKKHDFLTVIAQAPTYRKAENVLHDLKKNEEKRGRGDKHNESFR